MSGFELGFGREKGEKGAGAGEGVQDLGFGKNAIWVKVARSRRKIAYGVGVWEFGLMRPQSARFVFREKISTLAHAFFVLDFFETT